MFQMMVQSFGYDVDTLYDGMNALEAIFWAQPQVILLDLMLPRPGLNGYEIIEAVRANPDLYALPIIVVTADHSPEVRMRVIRLGADAYLTKPFGPNELRMALAEVLGR